MHNLSATALRNKFLKGEVLATEIATYFLKRIDSLDPQIGAYLSVFHEKAMEKAKILDIKKQKGQPLGKLAAIPVAIKDLIHVKGEITTCGSKFLSNYRAPFEATSVSLLQEEDALILGKTNLDEFGMGSSTENSAYKITYNPWNLKCTPGGSSGGSAASVSSRMSLLALGTDTGGSIRQPASFCGIVGFKPTYGRVSRYGMVAYGSSLDQIGPLATCTQDAALAMEVMGRHCAKDSTSIASAPQDYLNHLATNLKGTRIGIPFEFLKDLNPEGASSFEESLSVLKGLGAEIINVNLSQLKSSLAVYYILATAEASTNLARFDGIRYGIRSKLATTLDEVYDFSKEEGFGKEVKRRILLGTYVLSSGYKDAYYKQAQKVRTLIIQEYKEAFQKCDLIATPVSPFPAFEIGAIKDPLQMYLADIYTIAINLAGLPAISVPSGFSSDGKPLGLQLIGPQRDDVRVISCAHAFEQAGSYYKAIPELAK